MIKLIENWIEVWSKKTFEKTVRIIEGLVLLLLALVVCLFVFIFMWEVSITVPVHISGSHQIETETFLGTAFQAGRAIELKQNHTFFEVQISGAQVNPSGNTVLNLKERLPDFSDTPVRLKIGERTIANMLFKRKGRS
ncbi:MAG: hypothetical protein ACI9BD_000840 [Candidatus Marinamargulisbacteria bacterium]|jgi:hypothetical protein